jgi:hypothetical protein
MSIASRLRSFLSGQSAFVLSCAPLKIGGRYNERDAEETIAAALKNHPDCTVLDVGSNVGQFGVNLRNAGYRGRIISFEPTSAAHARLKQNAAHDANWTVAPRCAVGAKTRHSHHQHFRKLSQQFCAAHLEQTYRERATV